MEYSERVEQQQMTIALCGDVTVQEAEELKQRLAQAAVANRSITIDCCNVTKVDLCTLQLFTALETRLAGGAHLTIIDSKEHVLSRMIQLGGMTTLVGWPQQLVPTLSHGGGTSWQK